jgi:hypothetical protein
MSGRLALLSAVGEPECHGERTPVARPDLPPCSPRAVCQDVLARTAVSARVPPGPPSCQSTAQHMPIQPQLLSLDKMMRRSVEW